MLAGCGWASRFCCKNLEGQFWTPGGAISKVRSRVHLGNFRKKNGFQHSIFEPGFEKTGAKLREAVSELRSPTRFLSLFPPLPKSRKANLELRSPDHFALKRPQPKSGFSNRKKFPNLSPYIYDKLTLFARRLINAHHSVRTMLQHGSLCCCCFFLQAPSKLNFR